jgi:hypothetical protein
MFALWPEIIFFFQSFNPPVVVKLSALYAQDNQIIDFGPLSDLNILSSLSLWENLLCDLAPLPGLKSSYEMITV